MTEHHQSPWLTACSHLTAAIELLDGYRSMSETDFEDAHASACVHLRRADAALNALLDEQTTAQTRDYYGRCVLQLREWIEPIQAGDRRVHFRLVAIRDAVRLWWPDRRRVERDRAVQAA